MLPYGLDGEYNKHKLVGKKGGEIYYISWKEHIIEKYKNTTKENRICLKKYLTCEMRKKEDINLV